MGDRADGTKARSLVIDCDASVCDAMIDALRGAVETLLRLRPGATPTGARPRGHVLTFAGWRFDVARRRLFAASGGGCHLTISEARLPHTLLDNPNQVLARPEILGHLARSLSSPFDRGVDELVARLRRKIEADRRQPQLIETVRGVGYVLNAQVESVGSGTGGEK